VKNRLVYLAKTYLLTVLLFFLAKVVFMLFNHEGHPFTVADMAEVVWHGLSLDLSTALYFLIVPFLLTAVSLWVSIPRWAFLIYYVIMAVAFALAFVADTSLYPFWGFKLDASCLSYLETPTEAMASVSTGYLLVRLGVLIVSASLIFLAYSLISYHAPRISKKIAASALFLLMIPMMVIGIRGGLSESNTNIGQVYYSQNQFLNHSAVNPIFSFLYSLDGHFEDLSQFTFFETEESETLVKGIYTTASIGSDTLLTTQHPQIVIILLESAGEQFADVMPHLQQLKKEGINFNRCYANSWRTDRGTVAILSGYPTFPTVSIMKYPEKSRTMPGIALALKQQGYTTSYLYGGDINFTSMRSYLIGTGWEALTSMDDYSLDEQHSAKWGVRDDITFQTLFDNITNSATPHLWGYSTLSSHEPWDVPSAKIEERGEGREERGEKKEKTLWKENSDKVFNAFAYLDYCLYDFISRLKKTPQWKDLLIVITADHGINHGQIDNTTPLEKNHIPMVWVGGAIREPRIISTLCNQSDLAATLLAQLGLRHDEFAFSRDVLSESYTHPTAVNNYSNAQWIVDSTGHVGYDFDGQRFTVDDCRDSQQLLRVSKAILQVTSNDLQNR